MANPSPLRTPLAMSREKRLMRSLVQVAGMLPVLIVICILFAFLTESFLTTNNLINVVRQASINIVLAAGMTFVILTGGIDLAVGSVLGMTAVLSLLVFPQPGVELGRDTVRAFERSHSGVMTGRIVHYFRAASLYCHAGHLHGPSRSRILICRGHDAHQ